MLFISVLIYMYVIVYEYSSIKTKEKECACKVSFILCLEHYVKQQLFQSLPLHTGPSLNCPGETAELWQSELSWPLVRT